MCSVQVVSSYLRTVVCAMCGIESVTEHALLRSGGGDPGARPIEASLVHRDVYTVVPHSTHRCIHRVQDFDQCKIRKSTSCVYRCIGVYVHDCEVVNSLRMSFFVSGSISTSL